MPTREVIKINNSLRELDTTAARDLILNNLHLLTDPNKEPFKRLIEHPETKIEHCHGRLSHVHNSSYESVKVNYNYIPAHDFNQFGMSKDLMKSELSIWFRETFVFAGRIFVWERYIIKENQFLPNFPPSILDNPVFQTCMTYQVSLEFIPDCVKDYLLLS